MAENIGAGKDQGKTITYGNIHIKGHLLRLPDIVIQISNISGISISELTIPNSGGKIIGFGIICSLIAGIIFKFSVHSYYGDTYIDEQMAAVGVVVLIAAVGLIWFGVQTLRKGNSNKEYLNIYLSSGMRYSILFEDISFMKKVLNVFSNIFESGNESAQEYNINIKNCEFVGGSVVNPGTIFN